MKRGSGGEWLSILLRGYLACSQAVDLNGMGTKRWCSSIVCMCTSLRQPPEIPSKDAVQLWEVEYFEEYAVREYIDARIVACSLEI